MGNCISKISKGCLFAFKEFMKNKTSLEKGRVRPGLERLTGGDKHEDLFYKGAFKKKKRWLYYKLGCGGETFFYPPCG